MIRPFGLFLEHDITRWWDRRNHDWVWDFLYTSCNRCRCSLGSPKAQNWCDGQ